MAEENVIQLDDGLEQSPKDSQQGESPENPAQEQAQGGDAAKVNKVKELLNKFKPIVQPHIDTLKDNKPLMIGVIAVAVLIFIFIIVLVIVLLQDNEPEVKASSSPMSRKIIEPAPILGTTKRPEVDNTEFGKMIRKANLLYSKGDKMEALDLFQNIAAYSESIANYNLGVIKLRESDYKGAIHSFENAINTGKDISVSAFDAAYSAYMLNDMNLYEYYLGIASSYLFHTTNQPLYSYLYGLLQYYKGYYFESLSPFLNPSSSSYTRESKKLASEMFLVFGDEYNALAQLKQVAQKEDSFAIALLHARLGEYNQARQYLYEYLGHYQGNLDALMALQLIELKRGNFKESALLLERLNAKEEDAKIFAQYPIRVKLKDDLFDINLAQEAFWDRQFEHNKMLGYKLLFYYAPFRVFNAKDALEIIQSGNLNALSSNLESAKNILQDGQTVSHINQVIAQDLRVLTLYQDLREIIKSMEKSIKNYPNHSILHYNLGLLYAQMNDFDNAYAHFIRAYHLNGNDVMAGIFALICAELTYRDTRRLNHNLSNDFAEIQFDSPLEREFLLSLFRYTGESPADQLPWLKDAQASKLQDRKPIHYALNAVYGIYNADATRVTESFNEIKNIYPKDVVANTMYELGKRFRMNLKEFSLQMNVIYKEKNLDLRPIYYGPSLARELYVYVGFVTGSLRSIQEELEAKLIVETRSPNGILQALGLSNIYSNDFEKAFAIYNSLIDDLKEDDSQTRFLGAISAMGANRHENAVALLQLAKMESAINFEARYVLGLLYQEGKNIKAAIQHYDRISNTHFVSEFFDFEIDTTDLLDAHQDSEIKTF